jgi:hypothetical protein
MPDLYSLNFQQISALKFDNEVPKKYVFIQLITLSCIKIHPYYTAFLFDFTRFWTFNCKYLWMDFDAR